MIKLLILGFSFFSPAVEQDSIGVETVNGKVFVIHRVEEKETLFAISRRYGTSVDQIVQYNTAASNGLEIGQILKVPYTPKTVPAKTTDGITHRVAPKETLFSIAKTYNVSMDDIKQWNNLQDNALSIDQELIIKKRNSIDNTTAYQPATQSNTVISRKGVHTVAVKETMYSIARQYGITVDQLREWNTLEGNELKIGQILFVAQPDRSGLTLKQEEEKKQEATKTPVVTTTTPAGNTSTSSSATTSIPVTEKKEVPVKQEVKEQTIKISESVKNGDEVVQAGLAELIEGTEGNRKYLALHRTAPVGTILKIRNEMNNREVFVRVMGKLPESAVSDKLIIKISKSAYDRLGAIDPRFRVEVTYYK
jgi:LysM repeat protein